MTQEEVDLYLQIVVVCVEEGNRHLRVSADADPHPIGYGNQGDDCHASPAEASQQPYRQWKAEVELHLGAERPEHGVDAVERAGCEGMDHEQVRPDLLCRD